MLNRIRGMFGRKIVKYVIRKKNQIKIHFARQLDFGKMSLFTFFPTFIKWFSFYVFIKRRNSIFERDIPPPRDKMSIFVLKKTERSTCTTMHVQIQYFEEYGS